MQFIINELLLSYLILQLIILFNLVENNLIIKFNITCEYSIYFFQFHNLMQTQ